MKITFLTPHVRISGGVKNILTFANLLVERGHTVNVVTQRQGTPKWLELKANLLYVPDLQEEWMPEADIIVCTGGGDGPIVSNFGPDKGEKFVFFQGFGAHGVTKAEEAVAQMPFRKMVLASWIGDLLKERFGQDSILVRCPIDTDFFYPVNKRIHKHKVIGMLHHTVESKGFADGLEAFKLARKKHPEIKLVMFGCHGKPWIRWMPYCTFYHDPPQEKLREIYSSCDIWVCPSWTEGFGMTSAEAMACKCALVTTDNGGSKDFAFHNKTALVSPPKQPDLLAENVIRLIEDEDMLIRLSEAGYELIQTFTWEKATDIMENFFLETLKQRPKRLWTSR